MKAVILAGGQGTRISEETVTRPKPLIEIGSRPLLWHIMKLYSTHGVNDFVICLGYRGYMIKEYFANYFLRTCDITIDIRCNTIHVHDLRTEPWKVTLMETGEHTMTGGRLRRVRHLLENDDEFCLTYGDGLSDVDIRALIEFHRVNGKSATLTATQPSARFGAVELEEDCVRAFREKPLGGEGWINGGFFVLSPTVFDVLTGDDCVWEHEPVQRLAAAGQLSAYRHCGFWHPVDTLRDKQYLETLWREERAPWKVWP